MTDTQKDELKKELQEVFENESFTGVDQLVNLDSVCNWIQAKIEEAMDKLKVEIYKELIQEQLDSKACDECGLPYSLCSATAMFTDFGEEQLKRFLI